MVTCAHSTFLLKSLEHDAYLKVAFRKCVVLYRTKERDMKSAPKRLTY